MTIQGPTTSNPDPLSICPTFSWLYTFPLH